MLDVLLDSGFSTNRTLYFCYSEPGAGGNSTAMARARLADDLRSLQDNPFSGRAGALPETWSYGHRNTQAAGIGPDGALWVIEHEPVAAQPHPDVAYAFTSPLRTA